MNHETQYLSFQEQPQTGLTKIFNVYNKVGEELLGVIKWRGSFRKYAIESLGNIVYDAGCLRDIAAFLDKLMLERKISDQNKRTSNG